MQKRIIYLFLIIGAITCQLILVSCNSFITDVDPSLLPSNDSKLVIACFISPQDTVLSAKVTETKTVLGTGGTKADITNATVNLSDGTKTIQLIFDKNLAYYRALPSALKIEAGKTYNIAVSTPDGRKVTASTTVPAAVSIKEIKLDSATTVSTRRNNVQAVTEYTIKLIWQDKAGTADYYRGIGYATGLFTDQDKVNQLRTDVFDFAGLDDKNSDGQLLTLSVTYQPSNSRNTMKAILQKMTIGLFHTDVSYFNYHESLRKQRNNRNPFAEPVLLFTNVNNGFGCFGAYNAAWQNVKLK